MSVQRGRKSAESRSLLATAASLEKMARPEPPDDLTEDEAKVWRTIVDRMPSDWFPAETHPMLIQLCSHTCNIKFLRKMRGVIMASEKPDMVEYRKLIREEREQGRMIAYLSTRMRLSQLSSYDTQAASRAKIKALGPGVKAQDPSSKTPPSPQKKPWE